MLGVGLRAARIDAHRFIQKSQRLAWLLILCMQRGPLPQQRFKG